MNNLKNILNDVLNIVAQASHAVLDIYNTDFTSSLKSDNSPLTQADMVSNIIINEGLNKYNYPIISEESESIIVDAVDNIFWLVDPLDGTKEFINKNGEFTINIALIKDGRPILGVVSVPAQGVIYYALKDYGAYKRLLGVLDDIQIKCSLQSDIKQSVITVSRSHLHPQDAEFINKYQISNIMYTGSALKYCLIADGQADITVRHTPLMSWDIAASDIILEESDAKIISLDNNFYYYQLKGIYVPIIGLLALNNKLNIVY